MRMRNHLVTALLYLVGGAWFVWQVAGAFPAGWTATYLTVVFLPGEAVKIAVATGLILSLRGRVSCLLTAGMKEQRL